MTEGILSYLFLIALISIKRTQYQKSKYETSFFTVGILYLAKQFTSLLILLFILFFMLKKRDRSYALFGVSGILIKEIASVTYFSNIIKNYHLQEVDFLDLVLDLILLRDLKINNIFEILYNLSKDKPHSIF